MTEDWKPLYLLTEARPTPDQIEILKKAKKDSGLQDLIKPVRAVPGCGRVLVFTGKRPPFVCEWAYTSWGDGLLPQKLKWAVTGLDGKPHTVEEWLSDVMQGDVRLIREERWEGA